MTNDGCLGPSRAVRGAVVLYRFNSQDRCNSTVRCDRAAEAGAIGCLLYNVGLISGASTIPSGSVSLQDARRIIALVANDSSAIFTFTNLLQFLPSVSERMRNDWHENAFLADWRKTFWIQRVRSDG